ncbi:hypothetical protein GJ496_006340 [Pomphorhynchus laevis]|nr:hypothetical protein GJ496_006340 [Pomphorhynchus laevis]
MIVLDHLIFDDVENKSSADVVDDQDHIQATCKAVNVSSLALLNNAVARVVDDSSIPQSGSIEYSVLDTNELCDGITVREKLELLYPPASQTSMVIEHHYAAFAHMGPGDIKIVSIDKWVTSISDGIITDYVIVDFSRAFDLVPYSSLIQLLLKYRVYSDLVTWIKYLSAIPCKPLDHSYLVFLKALFLNHCCFVS